MSSVFSRKMTMSTSPGRFTGLGTPANQRTGRRQTDRSSTWRRVTLSERKAPRTGAGRGAAPGGEPAARPRAGVQVARLAERRVERADAAADGRRQRALDADDEL